MLERQLRYALSFLLMILFFNILLNQKFSPIIWRFQWSFLTFNFSYPAFLYGLSMAIILIAMLFIFSLLNEFLTPSKLIYVFSPVVSKLAMLLTISFTLVTNFTFTLNQISRLQKTRNLDIASGSLIMRTKKIFHIFEILLQDSLSSAMETAKLMDARGFRATRRTYYHSYHWHASDLMFIISAITIFLAIIVVRIFSMGVSRSVASFTTILVPTDSLPIINTTLLFLLPIISERVYHACIN